jgi:hypothetical protein
MTTLLGDLHLARTAYGLLQQQPLVKVNPLDEPTSTLCRFESLQSGENRGNENWPKQALERQAH